MKELRIGYVPYTPDLSAPGDRRRFCFYARNRGLDFEVFRTGRRYDLVIVSTLGDLTAWSRKPHGDTTIVFDLPDSYFAVAPLEPKALLRGTAKFLLRQHRHWEWSYHESLRRMCRRADAVVCSTPEQRDQIIPHNPNVHAILDFHDRDALHAKRNYKVGDRINLVWEGLGGNVFTLQRLAGALRDLSTRIPLALHLITDLTFKPFNGPLPKRSTRRLVEHMLPGIEVYLYQWHRDTFAAIATACDMAIIPIPMEIPVYRAKAENKLLLFWRIGLPVLTSPTPAYTRTMAAAGLDMTCSESADWVRQVDRLAGEEKLRRDCGQRGREYAEAEYGTAAQMNRWDTLFKRLQLIPADNRPPSDTTP